MNSGSTSIDRQSETQAPHWMHAIVCVTSTMFSCGTMYSRSGIGSLLTSHGVTRWIFFQWTSSMSTIRSLSTGMLPIGSTSITPSREEASALSRCVWHASAGLPVDPHAARAADRRAAGAADADRAVEARLGLQDPLEHGAVRLELDGVLVPVRRLARLGVVAADAELELLLVLWFSAIDLPPPLHWWWRRVTDGDLDDGSSGGGCGWLSVVVVRLDLFFFFLVVAEAAVVSSCRC